jgi:hypothetical protein
MTYCAFCDTPAVTRDGRTEIAVCDEHIEVLPDC